MKRLLRVPSCASGLRAWFFLLGILAALALPARAMDQAKPGMTPDPHAGMTLSADSDLQSAIAFYEAQNRTAFEQAIQLDDFRLLAVQHLDQMKIIDSWARQSLRTIHHYQTIDGKDSVYLALDMAMRPEAWLKRNIIYIESVPIREELGELAGGQASVEGQRIRKEAMVSPAFLLQQRVLDRLEVLSRDSRQVQAVNKVYRAMDAFVSLGKSLAILPPTADQRTSPWVNPADVDAQAQQRSGATAPAPTPPMAPAPAADSHLPPYTTEQILKIRLAYQTLVAGWQRNDAAQANQGLAQFVQLVGTLDPPAYPSAAKRTVELWYNRTFSGTLVAFLYFIAMALFFVVAVGVARKAGKVRRVALGFFAVALACHILAMGVRWWINGRIPIQNQFESVMGSACLGCIIGMALETWKKNGIFGAAFTFVGFLATTVLMAAPYVFGTDLGAAPAKVAGILNTGWLYIHVNIVIASYALILASAAIALIFLGLRQWHWVNPLEPGFEDAAPDAPGGNAGPQRRNSAGSSPALDVNLSTQQIALLTKKRRELLDTLDQANMVVLQMAFWMLGVGILCGAVWADQSWGRPWGWDPKETFALVTWLVYLIIVHIRLVIKQKSDTTAVLALVGCGVMLFNWIFVNFFLVGLHSYA